MGNNHLGFSDRAGWVPDDSDSHWFQWIWGYPKPKLVALDTAQRAATGHEVSSLGHGGAGDGQRDGRSWAGGPWGSMEKGFGEKMREKYGQCPPLIIQNRHLLETDDEDLDLEWFGGIPHFQTHTYLGLRQTWGKAHFFADSFLDASSYFRWTLPSWGMPLFLHQAIWAWISFFFGSRKSHSWASQFLAILLWGLCTFQEQRGRDGFLEYRGVMQQR